MWHTDKVVFTEKFTALNIYILKEEKYQVNNLSFYLVKEEQNKLKAIKKEMINVRADVNEIKYRKTMKLKPDSLER